MTKKCIKKLCAGSANDCSFSENSIHTTVKANKNRVVIAGKNVDL